MEYLRDFAPLAGIGLKALVLLALPLAAGALIWGALRRLAPDGFFAVPMIYTAGRLAGLGLGLLLVLHHQDSRNFDLHEIFVPGGPWDISFARFLSERANPLAHLASLLATPWQAANTATATAAPGSLVLIALAPPAALLALALAWAWRIWPPAQAARANLAVTITATAIACLTIYGVSLLFWLLFLLNSWTFLILVIALQYLRNRK
jgi:hypothetical protein